MKTKTIMIVEDEVGIREMTQMYLEREGYHVIVAESGEQALEHLQSMSPHLILLDIEMSGIDGFTVCQEIRKKMTIPIIFLTVRRRTLDKIRCFELGGDDYVTKPFVFEELHARIKANIRRYKMYPQRDRNILTYENLEIHLHNYECYVDGKQIKLAAKEMELLIHLAKNPNQVWSQEQLYDSIWGIDAVGNFETVKVHMTHLRRKLEKGGLPPHFIKTVRGFGYLFKG